jgi:hypothetical protein
LRETKTGDEKMASKANKKNDEVAVIKRANIVRTTLKIRGLTPLVINKFSKKQRDKMMADMAATKAQKKGKSERPPRDYEDDFQQARHVSQEGWDGIHAAAFRCAMIDACRTVGLVMTKAKMAVFIIADGWDRDEGTPLVRILGGEPEQTPTLVRNDNGSADIRVRPMWREWSANITIEFDADMITPESVVNLLDRAGRQVGICEGRPFSKNSAGMDWGRFTVVEAES